jgi:modulator of FtsH protease HflC
MASKIKNKIIGLVVVVIAVIVLASSLYTIDEGNQVVITRFGSIVGTHTEAGIYFKIPFLDKTTKYTKLILSLDGDPQRIPTKEKQFIVVDTTSRWRISDPVKFYQSFTTVDNAYNRLSDIVDSATRTIITQNRLSEIVRSSNIINDIKNSEKENEAEDEDSKAIEDLVNTNTDSELIQKGRNVLCKEMTAEANKLVPDFGIELIDIVPRQIKYSDELTESVYNRMIKERNQVAQAYRSRGEGKKAEWLGRVESEKLAISSSAYKKAEEIKGNADAQAAAIYAEAYNKDPEFFTFWRSMESYKTTLKNADVTYSTNMDYFKYLYNSNGTNGR